MGAAEFGDIWEQRNSERAETPLNGVSSDVRERTDGHFEKNEMERCYTQKIKG